MLNIISDYKAVFNRDPAARTPLGFLEVLFIYSGFHAVLWHRINHFLHAKLRIPFIPRFIAQIARWVTGIEIHPGAQIGPGFFIDHGTGVVVGETTEIGNRVRIYQGVTLGALSMPKEAVESFRDKKPHPTIEDDVIVYSNTTILGGETIIGARSTIGGNVWITESVPPDTKVYLKKPELIYSGNGPKLTDKDRRKNGNPG